ncbi:GNAT family N-acetyltransferase [Frigidibacter sp. MR17.24]|uniref:GNAT family N-acetyltransferase n=1 Tax=Frigidibacter sp. MR17.24 TaxID=3127345 RepID=UPI003012F36D
MQGWETRVRPAVEGDVAAVVAMVAALAAHHGDVSALTPEGLLRDAFGADPWVRLLIATRTAAGAACGYAALTRRVRLQEGLRRMELHHLYVAPGQRGLGLGRALVTASAAVALGLGCDRLSVGTDPDNLAAQGFYRGCGFRRLDTFPPMFALDLAG